MINCVSMGCPLPLYIKDGGGGGRPRQWCGQDMDSYIFYEDLYRSDRITTYVVPFVHRYVTCPRFDRRYPIPSSISLPASLFTRSVIHHPATNSLVAMLARLK